jgi:hypothetical protein
MKISRMVDITITKEELLRIVAEDLYCSADDYEDEGEADFRRKVADHLTKEDTCFEIDFDHKGNIVICPDGFVDKDDEEDCEEDEEEDYEDEGEEGCECENCAYHCWDQEDKDDGVPNSFFDDDDDLIDEDPDEDDEEEITENTKRSHKLAQKYRKNTVYWKNTSSVLSDLDLED